MKDSQLIKTKDQYEKYYTKQEAVEELMVYKEKFKTLENEIENRVKEEYDYYIKTHNPTVWFWKEAIAHIAMTLFILFIGGFLAAVLYID